jgi:hypothetical protein
LHSSHLQTPKTLAFALSVLVALLAPAAGAANSDFFPQMRVGYTEGDQWEPAIAADGYGHVYILYPQYGSVPGCSACRVPTIFLLLSNNNGGTWDAPRQIQSADSGQFDPQIVVDPADRRTVYAAWLQNEKRDVVVAKSVDLGQTWSPAVASSTRADADKPVLAVRGMDVYVGFNRGRRLWVASSHDAGNTFSSATVNSNYRLSWSLPSGATVDPAGNVYFSWVAYAQKAGARGPVDLYISKSSDAGQSWGTTLLDVSGAPPSCEFYKCGWSYLGAQITMASDAAGTLYALWNAGSTRDRSPERIYFSSSTTAGASWSPKVDISSAAPGVDHAFPAITAGLVGDVRIAWMDTRQRPFWNTYYRNSTDGGATWSQPTRLSTYVPGYGYIRSNGFNFPFGDYFEMAIDSRGQTQVVWGEGQNFESPGSIWYTSGR